MNMSKTNNENSGDKHCDYNNFKRARYFHGMLMTDRDFREEQIYHNEKRKLLNRMLHGWGVVCGLGIMQTDPSSSKIIITPGVALDCEGNEIVVCENFEVDLSRSDICPDVSEENKECREAKTAKEEGKYYVAIKYTEVPTDPVPVYSPGGGCEEKVCEYSRMREGFCVKLFRELPCGHEPPKPNIFQKIQECLSQESTSFKGYSPAPKQVQIAMLQDPNKILECMQETFCETLYTCPRCYCEGEPYIVIGSINFNKNENKNTSIIQEMISINDERRYVLTSLFWQNYLSSLFPKLDPLLDNPFSATCIILKGIIDMLKALINKKGSFGKTTKGKVISNLMSVSNMEVDEAKKSLKKNFNPKNINTIPLSPDSFLNIAIRAFATEKIEPGMNVDLVTDEKTGKVLFYIPTTVVPEKEELHTRLQKAEEIIKELQEKVNKLEEK